MTPLIGTITTQWTGTGTNRVGRGLRYFTEGPTRKTSHAQDHARPTSECVTVLHDADADEDAARPTSECVTVRRPVLNGNPKTNPKTSHRTLPSDL